MQPTSGLASVAIFHLLVRAAATLPSSSTAFVDASLASDQIQHFDIAKMAFAKALVQYLSVALYWSRSFLGTRRMALLAEHMCDNKALR